MPPTDLRRRPHPGQLGQWALWFAALAATVLLLLVLRTRLDKAHVALVFLLVVLGGSSAAGRVLGVALAAAAFVAFNFFFLPPYNTLIIAEPLDWLVLIAFFITGIAGAQLLERQRRATEVAVRRADEIDRLAILGAETLNAARAEDALDAIGDVIREAMATDRCEIFLRQAGGGLRLGGQRDTGGGGEAAGLLAFTVERDEAAAQRADGTLSVVGDVLHRARDDQPAPPLADLRALGIPLRVRGRIVGALRLSADRPFTLSDDQRRVLGALAYYAALGTERVRLAEAEAEAEALRRADRLKDALLASVSHDLRTPLTAIKGIAHEIWHGGAPDRAQVIEQEADRLGDLVSNLLDLSQLTAGSLPVATSLNTVDDVLGAALDRAEAVHGMGRIEVRIDSASGILVGEFDLSHTIRIVTNLLDNALKYSPGNALVLVHAWREGERLRIAVEDSGGGVPPGDEERIFEPFFRAARVADGARGTGLGLSIARQLAELQGGVLAYARRAEGGSRFTLELPAGAAPPG